MRHPAWILEMAWLFNLIHHCSPSQALCTFCQRAVSLTSLPQEAFQDPHKPRRLLTLTASLAL